MNNFWYVSRSNEIFVDTDNFSRSIRHTASRLGGAIKCGRLDVKQIEYHTSNSEDHLHTLITLNVDMPEIERMIWALILHSDIYRTAANVMRSLYNVSAPDVLITPERFRRFPDDACQCEDKHKAEVMIDCPAAIRLRGSNRARGFFGKPENDLNDLDEVIATFGLSDKFSKL